MYTKVFSLIFLSSVHFGNFWPLRHTRPLHDHISHDIFPFATTYLRTIVRGIRRRTRGHEPTHPGTATPPAGTRTRYWLKNNDGVPGKVWFPCAAGIVANCGTCAWANRGNCGTLGGVQGGATLGAIDGPRAWCGGKLWGLNIVVDTDEGTAGKTTGKAAEAAAGTREGDIILGGNMGDDNKLEAAKCGRCHGRCVYARRTSCRRRRRIGPSRKRYNVVLRELLTVDKFISKINSEEQWQSERTVINWLEKPRLFIVTRW